MTISHDVFAETNPAFCTFVLVAFAKAYMSIDPAGPEIPMVYLALPIALSGELADVFSGTNKNTGLLEWLERSPEVQVDLAERVNASLDIVTEAVRLSCFAKALSITHKGRLQPGSMAPKKMPLPFSMPQPYRRSSAGIDLGICSLRPAPRVMCSTRWV